MSDLEKLFPWLKKAGPIRPGPRRRAGKHSSIEFRSSGQGGEFRDNGFSLGHGTFTGLLPVGWFLEPVRPLEGRFQTEDGDWLAYKIDCYDDAEAAQGGPRLLAYLDEPEFHGTSLKAADVIHEIHVSVPKEGARDIVWKWIEPQGGRFVRELTLRTTPGGPDDSAERRLWLAEAVGEWLRHGSFAEEETALDRVAHTSALERVNFENNLLMRVPRAWKIEIDHTTQGRAGYAVDEPQDRETLWVTSFLVDLRDRGKAAAEAALAEMADAQLAEIAAKQGPALKRHRRETLADGDCLAFAEIAEKDGKTGEALRRRSWIRYGLRDGWLVTAPVHLVTAEHYLDRPEQVESEATADREIRNALLLPPVPEKSGG